MSQPEIYLKKNEDKRLRKGHLWVFSNEVDTKRSPLEQFSPGDLVQVKSDDGKVLGTAYVNPQTLICARLLSRKPNLKCGVNFLKSAWLTLWFCEKNSLISPTIDSFLVKAMACLV